MRPNPDFVARRVSNEMVLVPISSDAASFEGIFTLNEVGARIWELVSEGHDAEGITAALCAEYEVAPEVAGQDVAELLGQLRQVNAILDDAPGGS